MLSKTYLFLEIIHFFLHDYLQKKHNVLVIRNSRFSLPILYHYFLPIPDFLNYEIVEKCVIIFSQ